MILILLSDITLEILGGWDIRDNVPQSKYWGDVSPLSHRDRRSWITTGVPAVLKFLKLQSCPEIVKFEIVLKSQSFSINVLILTIVVRAQ